MPWLCLHFTVVRYIIFKITPYRYTLSAEIIDPESIEIHIRSFYLYHDMYCIMT